jgi:spore coat protein A
MSGGIGRRGLLTAALAGAAGAGIGVPLLAGRRGNPSAGVLLPSEHPLPRPYERPLVLPPTLKPVRTDGTTDFYELTQRAADVELLPGVRTPIWGYEGVFPGPTIVSRSGRRTVVTHRNELPVPVVVHLHGGRTPAESDGYPTDLVLPPGMALAGAERHGDVSHGSRRYTYPLDQRAATLWYHDHRMDFTGPSVWRGLAGFHLVRDGEEETLGLPAGDREWPLMITDRSFSADGSLRYPSLDPGLEVPGVRGPWASGVLGDAILVNGVISPYAQVPAVRHRLRLLNASNARRYRLALDPPPPGGGGLVQIGSDGGLLDRPIAHDAIEFAPAERFDVVVDFGRYRPGQAVELVNEFGSGSTRRVMRFRVGAAARDDSRVPATLSRTEELAPGSAAASRAFRFRNGTGGWLINGQSFDPHRFDAVTRLGDAEVWTLQSDFHHPVHLHLAPFKVLSRNRKAPGAYDAGWKDTVDLRPFEEVQIIARFSGYRGRFVFHCHNLEHEDMAMMANFLVT